MPGWYIHLEAAKLAADRLRAADVPPGLGLDPTESVRLGELCHTWRNYLAVGALGPDLFYLLPDFKDPVGSTLMHVVTWLLDTWETIDTQIIGPYEDWFGSTSSNDADLINGLTSGLAGQLGAAIDELSGAMWSDLEALVTRFHDLFGILTSGPPQGVAESAFYWSDMCHYRRTYEVPRRMYEVARDNELAATNDKDRFDAQAQQAFALGWMSHCATDVTGHAFTNAKSGGPFRLHWQRHHLVENHFDSQAYTSQHGMQPTYATFGTSGLHFRIVFGDRTSAPYAGRMDAPLFDYFGAFPAYPTGPTAADANARHQRFDKDTHDLPDHLVAALMETLKTVYADELPDITPEVFNTTDPTFGDDGRPNEKSLRIMWNAAFRYLRMMSSSGFAVMLPPPPSVIVERPFPSPPGANNTDADQGAEMEDRSPTLLDILLAIVAWVIYLGEVAAWVASLGAAALDPATFPARASIYYGVVVPLHDFYLACRRLLVMTGFHVPEPEEVDAGLTTLGISSTYWTGQLLADLADLAGFSALLTPMDEPSGRPTRTSELDADSAYPRDTPRDPQSTIDANSWSGVSPVPPTPPPFGDPYSEWVAPWRYPNADLDGDTLGWEGDLTHAGPFTRGERADTLLTGKPTHVPTAADYEGAATPQDTEGVSHVHLPLDQHLGHPVDYTLYLVSRLTTRVDVPDFNLDSDRGYGWRCWDWDRHDPTEVVDLGTPADPTDDVPMWEAHPQFTFQPAPDPTYVFAQPCSPPAQLDPAWVHDDHSGAAHGADVHRWSAARRLLVHYLEGPGADDPRCKGVVTAPVTDTDRERAMIPPEGKERQP